MSNSLILEQDPFVGFMPDDIRNWLSLHSQDENIALAMMHVHNKVGRLMHESEEYNDAWADFAFMEWKELETEITETIIRLLESNTFGKRESPERAGTYYRIKPFMERNGYRDYSGWWIPAAGESALE